MLNLLLPVLAWSVLVAGLTLPAFAPELSNDVMLALIVAALLHFIWVPNKSQFLAHPAAWMPMLGGLLLFVAFGFSATSLTHWVAFLVLGHLYMVGPLAALLARLGPALTLERVAALSLVGVAGGAVVGAIDIFWFKVDRAGLVNNPIHLADISLLLGFIALVGIWGQGRWRAIYLLGPVLGLIAVQFTGSRGPLVAFAPMLGVALIALSFTLWSKRTAVLLTAGTTLVLTLGIAALLYIGPTGWLGPLDHILELLHSGNTDDSTAQRLIMYQGAYSAFVASPLTGYGLLDYFSAAAAHGPAGVPFPIYEHLHNDIANFAVAGGALGLIAYALFLLAPLAAGMRARGQMRIPLIYLGAVTTAGFFAMGMTNVMVGLRWQDIILATVLALIATLSPRRNGHTQ